MQIGCTQQFIELGMTLSANAAKKLSGDLRPEIPISLIHSEFMELTNRAVEEFESVRLLYVPPQQANLLDRMQPFGAAVEARFPASMPDIEESCKCLALERATASVFHLGRALELAMHAFSSVLNCQIPSDRDWGKFVTAITDAVADMPAGTEQERSKKSEYSQAATNLYLVKLSWRNSTMPPKSYYSQEEASEVHSAAKTFMRHLAGLI